MLYLLRCQKWFEEEDCAYEMVDICLAESPEEVRAKYKNSPILDLKDWKEMECRPLTLGDIERHALDNEGVFTLIEGGRVV